MDEFDLRIIRVLQEHPDLSVADLGERVGLSHTPCWRRVKRLEEDGIIQGRALVLNEEALNLSVTVLVSIKLKEHDENALEEFEAAVRASPWIVSCFSLSGEYDYQLRIVTASIADYEHLMKKVIVHLPHFGSLYSSFVLKRVKLTNKLPI
jgi:Lrp/AsnC family transcriptional regulator